MPATGPIQPAKDKNSAGHKSNRWFYKILIESLSDRRMQLRSRTWNIMDGEGAISVISGRGVISQLPVFESDNRAFQYTSCVSLSTPSGSMR